MTLSIVVTAPEMEYSPWVLGVEDPKITLLQTCRELGVSVVATRRRVTDFLTGQTKSGDNFTNKFRYPFDSPKILVRS
jgi:hypothetical protein